MILSRHVLKSDDISALTMTTVMTRCRPTDCD